MGPSKIAGITLVALVTCVVIGALGCGDDGSAAAPLGPGTASPDASPAYDGGAAAIDPVVNHSELVQLAAGASSICAVFTSGRPKCWGDNGSGQLGQGNTSTRGDEANEMGASLPPTELGAGRTARSVAVGVGHACAVLDDGSLKCWGDNGLGRLGEWEHESLGTAPGQMGDALQAVALGTGRTAKNVCAGAGHTCAVLDDGRVKCWGANESGQLGLDDTKPRGGGADEMGDALPAVALGGGRTAKTITCSAWHTCALLDDDHVKCWGRNQRGQLGVGDTANRGDTVDHKVSDTPVVDLGLGRVARAVSAGVATTCALLDDGQVKCWGSNGAALLGTGDAEDRGDGPGEMGDHLPPVDLGANARVVSLATGSNQVCVALASGAVKCWGLNSYGQLGQGDTAKRGDATGQMGDALHPVDLGGAAVFVTSGQSYNCAALAAGGVKCWGENMHGQLGLGDRDPRGVVPNQMGTALPPVDLGR